MATTPPIGEDAVAHDLDLGDEQHDAEEDQQEAAPS